MANFNTWFYTPGKRRYNRVFTPPLYSDDPNDPGNYNSAGQLVGTMRSISAPAWESYTGRTPSAADMQAITETQAAQFYKAKVWDDVLGDRIKSQIIAEFAADIKSSTGNVRSLQKALNTLGAQVAEDGAFGEQTLNAVNAADSFKLYEAFRNQLVNFYSNANQTYSAAWLRDLDKYYPQRAPDDPVFKDSSGGAALAQDLALTAIIFLAILLVKKFIMR